MPNADGELGRSGRFCMVGDRDKITTAIRSGDKRRILEGLGNFHTMPGITREDIVSLVMPFLSEEDELLSGYAHMALNVTRDRQPQLVDETVSDTFKELDARADKLNPAEGRLHSVTRSILRGKRLDEINERSLAPGRYTMEDSLEFARTGELPKKLWADDSEIILMNQWLTDDSPHVVDKAKSILRAAASHHMFPDEAFDNMGVALRGPLGADYMLKDAMRRRLAEQLGAAKRRMGFLNPRTGLAGLNGVLQARPGQSWGEFTPRSRGWMGLMVGAVLLFFIGALTELNNGFAFLAGLVGFWVGMLMDQQASRANGDMPMTQKNYRHIERWYKKLVRAKGKPAWDDYFEKKGIDFHRKVQAGYKALSQKFPQRVRLVDANPDDIQKVHENVYNAVKDLFYK